MDVNEAISHWRYWQEAAATATENEKQWRLYVAAMLVPTPTIGTNRAPVGNSREAKLVQRQNFKIDKERIGPALALLPPALQSVVKWEPRISQSAYDMLEPKHRAIINEALTISTGLPSLEIIDKAD